MNKEMEIINILKRERAEISKHENSSNLVKLYNFSIELHERDWCMKNGIILKSKPIDFKTILDEYVDVEKSKKCKDCEVPEDVRYIRYNKLGQLTYDD